MSWVDLNYYDIVRTKDETLKKQYLQKYYFYITKISRPVIDYLKEQGLNFKYSKSVRTLTIKEMAQELKQFYLNNNITQEEIDNIFGLKR